MQNIPKLYAVNTYNVFVFSYFQHGTEMVICSNQGHVVCRSTKEKLKNTFFFSKQFSQIERYDHKLINKR